MDRPEKNNISGNIWQSNDTESKCNLSENNMEKNISQFSEIFSNCSIKINDEINESDSSIIFPNIIFKKRYLSYENKQEIPIIIILGDNQLEYDGQEYYIDSFIKKFVKNEPSDNDIYNKCGICHQDLNKYFCQKCSKNLCENCSKKLCDKYKKIHDLINLDEEEKRADKYINLINEIIQKVKKYIKVREKQKDNENFINNNKSEIKDAKDYSLEFNKDKIKKERTKYEELFNNDFEIADIILAQKFKNQFFLLTLKDFLNILTMNIKIFTIKNLVE